MKLDPNDWIQSQLFFIGYYEEFELEVMKNFLKNGGVFIDIGANIGLYSLTAAKLEGVSVLAFEPYLPAFKILTENIYLNSFKNIESINKAIGREAKESKLYYNELESNLGMVSEFPSEFTTQQSVDFVSLDDYLEVNKRGKISYIKIDIEGGEYNALLGMKVTLLTHQPVVQIEVNESIISLETSNNIFKLMESYHYEEFNPSETLILFGEYQTKNLRNKFFKPKGY